MRLAIGAVLGAISWPVLRAALPVVPEIGRFVLAWLLFTFGPGIVIVGRLVTRDLDRLTGILIALGAGSAATPVIDRRARLRGARRRSSRIWRRPSRARVSRPGGGRAGAPLRMSTRDAAACAALVALCVVFGVLVFGNRLGTTAAG